MIEPHPDQPVKPAKAKRPPVIRRGNKTPYIKCTKEAFEDRTIKVAYYIGAHPNATRGELKRWINSKWSLSHRQCGVYIACAKNYIRKQASMSRDEAKEIAIGVLRSMLQGESARIRLRAVKQWVDIFGLEAPHKHELTGAEGGPIVTDDISFKDMPTEQLLKMASQAVQP